MSDPIVYWNAGVETAERAELEAMQLAGLRRTVAQALRTPFYRTRLAHAGVRSAEDLRTLSDLERLPFTTKSDLREAYPDGLLAVDRAEVVRLHTSSGTTGTPTVIYHTREDLENWTELLARCIVSTGATRADVFQNMMTYGLFTGGLGLHYGAERAGLLVIPSGAGNTARQLRLMKDFRSTVLHATPSYMLHLHSKMAEEGYRVEDLCLTKAYLGGEPYSENTRGKIESLFRIDVYNSYGLSEMNGPGVAFECVRKHGMHIWEDSYIIEMSDPRRGTPLADGEEGELVLTTLRRTATPILRYRTGDITALLGGACPCGRTHRRMARVTGRCDDMLILNGVNVYPQQIEQILMRIPGVGTNYLIDLDKAGALDRLTVKVEIQDYLFTGDVSELEALKARIAEDVKSGVLVRPVVELHEHGALPAFEMKAKRVTDLRPKE